MKFFTLLHKPKIVVLVLSIIFISLVSFSKSVDNSIENLTVLNNEITNPSFEINSSSIETFQSGTLIIPMDNILQGRNNGTGGFNLMAYGLVTRLLHADIPVQWAINSSKVKDGIDFTANSRRLLPTTSSSSDIDYSGSAFIIQPGYETAALTVINNFNDVIIPGIGGLGNGYKVKVNVYELSSQTQIEIAHVLIHKPKAAILNNGGNAGIQERVFKFAGLSENDHYSLGLFAADIDPDSCFTFVSEAHASEGSVSASEVSSIRQFVLDGGNFLAQCAAGRSYEQYNGNRLLTQSGVTDPGIGGNIVFDNPSDPVIQIIGGLSDEGGSAKSYRPINGYQAGTDVHRHAHDSNDGINHKFYGGKVSGAPGLGGNVYYLAGHEYEGQGNILKDNGYRIYLNALLMPSSRPISCGLGVAKIGLIKNGFIDDIDINGDCISTPGQEISYTFTVKNTGTTTLTNIIVTDPVLAVVGGPISLNPGEEDDTTFSGTYTITQSDISAGEFSNQAEVTALAAAGITIFDFSDDSSFLEDDPTITQICQNPDIALIKQGAFNDENQDGCADVNETITYSFTVKNTGNVSVTDITITDNLVTVNGGPIASLAPGAEDSTTYTATYSITQADIDSGFVTNSATVEGSGPNSSVGDVSDDNSNIEDDPTVTPLCQDPSIALVKVGTYDGFDVNGDCIAAVGDQITYSFTVTNTGNSTLTNVTVTDAGVTMVGGPIASLAPGAVDSTTYTATYSITQADIDAGEFSNQATVEGTAPDSSTVTDVSDFADNTQDRPTVTSICSGASIALVKVGTYDGFDVNGDCIAAVGDQITYSFTVTNTGNSTLTNVTVTDAGVTMVGGPIASLAPGAVDSTTYTATYSITQADIDAGEFSNQATVEGTAPDSSTVTDVSDFADNTQDRPTVTSICSGASIALVKVGTYDGFDVNGDCIAAVGDQITYSFTVTNTGNSTLTNVTVTDAGVTMVGGPIASLAPGAVDSTTYTATYSITQADIDAGEFSNQATVEGTAPDSSTVTDVSDFADNTQDRPTVTSICSGASIALVKLGTYDGFDVNGDCIAAVGDQITYSFTVTNTGNSTLTNVTVTDAGVTMVGGPIASLAPGAVDSTTYTATYSITQADIDAGEFSNQATVEGTAPDSSTVTDVSDFADNTQDRPTVTSICSGASIALVKVGTYDGFDVNGDCIAAVGDQITYSFTVTNTGNSTLTNVTVTDAGVTMVGGPIASLAPGAVDSTTYTATYSITQADIDAGEFSNQATVEGTAPDSSTVTDVSDFADNTQDRPTVTSICSGASIALVKVGTYDGFDVNGDCIAAVGDQITYSFTVTNTGNSTLTNVTVTDAGVTMVGGPIASLAPGAVDSTTYTATYSITQADIDAGEFSNQATVEGTAPDSSTVTDVSDFADNTQDRPTVTSICSGASIALVKLGTYDGFDVNGDCIAAVGDQITYSFTVTNTGNSTLTNVTVTDAGVTMVGGPIASLAPGAVDSTTYTATYSITQADIDAGEFSNQATVEGTAPDSSTVTDVSDFADNTQDRPTVTSICSGASIALVKLGTYDGFDVNGDCIAAVGDQITYSFTVTNTGNSTLTNVTVTDAGVTMVGGPIASLAPGAVDSTTYTATYSITQADIDAGEFSNQATVEGTAPDSSTVTDVSDFADNTQDRPTVTSICSGASIALVKVGTYDGFDVNGDCIAAVGDQITYSFTVTNTGNSTLTNVTVTDAGVTMVGGPIASLAPGAVDSTTYTATYSITQADIDAGEFSNQATVEGTAPDSSTVTDVSDFADNTQDRPTVTSICSGASIALVKLGTYDGFDVNGDCIAAVGDQITYSFTVTNTGNSTLTNVTVTDAGVTMVGGPIASLAPGAVDSTTYTATYSITQADIDAGEFSNQATVEGTAPDSSTVTDVSDFADNTQDRPTVTSICSGASIALVKVGTYDGFDVNGDCIAAVGDQITYSFTVTNTGNSTLTNVTVTDAGVTMVGGPIASLAPGAVDSTTYTATYSITQADIDAGEFSNQATVEGTAPDSSTVTDVSDFADNTQDRPTVTSICSGASIALVKVGTYDGFDVNGDCIAAVGDQITYSFTVTNTGNSTLTNVTVTDAGVTMVGGPIASLAPGAVDSTTYTATYSITQADIDAGEFSNQATVEGTAPDSSTVTDVSDFADNTQDRPTVTSICSGASIALVKVGTYDGFDVNGDCIAAVGDQITYSFTVTNTGNSTLTNVTVTDAGVTMVGGPIASLAPGAVDSTTYTATYSITQADIDAGEFSNQATVEGTAPDSSTVTDVSDFADNTQDRPTVTSICSGASIALVKLGTYDGFDVNGDCIAAVGDQITYSFTVTNTGNSTLTNVTVTDAGVTMVGGPIASLAPGAVDSTTYTATYSITQADIDAGEFSNQATVEGTAPDSSTVTDVSDFADNTQDRPTVTSICSGASIALVKVGTYDGFDVNGDCIAAVGDQITYSFTVTNTGNSTLTNVTVTDAGVTMVGGPIASLAPGAVDSTTYTATYSITQADIDAGEFSNQATVEGTAPDSSTVTDVSDFADNTQDRPTVTSICSGASIALVKVGTYDGFDVNGDCIAAVGDQITYSFTVTNTGNSTLTNVTVTDAGVTMVGGPIASLAPGAVDSTTYTATYSITQADIDAGEFSNQATVEGTAPDSSTVTDVSDFADNTQDRPTVTSICSGASIALVKLGTYDGFDVNGDCIAAVGDQITYSFTVTNTGNSTLTNVTVTDAGVTMVGGPIASLAPGAVDSTTYTATYSITQADIDAGEFSNQATVEGTAPDSSTVTDVSDFADNTQDRPTVTSICSGASIALVKLGTYDGFDVNGDCIAAVGDQITYSFTVTNTGNSTLTNVTVTDAGVTMVGGPIASLAPGAVDSTTYTATYSITQADIDAGEFSNQATVEGTAPDSSTVTDVSDFADNTQDRPTVTSICSGASIALVKLGTYDGFDVNGDCIAAVGDQITYSFTVTNTGNSTLTNVTVTDAGVTMVGGPIASLAPGAVDSTTYTATYSITQADIDAGEFSNQATVEGTAPDSSTVTDVSDFADNTQDRPTVTSICSGASIALVKVGTYDGFDVNGDCIAAVGDQITYSFTVTNTGNSTLTNVTVTDAGVTMVGGPIASLAPGAVDSTTYTATYSITQADIDAGEFSNQATVEGTAPDSSTVTDVSDFADNTQDRPTVTSICSGASIALVKVGTYDGFDVNGDCIAAVGDQITYSFTVTNTGNSTLTNVTVTDAGVTMVGGPIASLAPGAVDSTTYTATYSITQADIDAGEFSNQATVEGTAPDSSTVTDVSDFADNTQDRPTVTSICSGASIAIIKSHDQIPLIGFDCIEIKEFQEITYSFEVTNQGNLSLTNILVNDPLPGLSPLVFLGGDTNNDSILDLNETWYYEATYIASLADVDLGYIINQATVTGDYPSGQVSDLSGNTVLTDEETEIEICQFPEIELIKYGVFNDENQDGCSDVGETIKYTFTVINTGNVTLSNVTVTDPLITVNGGPIVTLLPGPVNQDETTFTGTYTITQEDIDAGYVQNQATAESVAPDQSIVTDLSDNDGDLGDDDPTITDLCQDPSIALVKEADIQIDPSSGCYIVEVGGTIDYIFTVTNTGNTTLTNVVVIDNGVDMNGDPIASLAPGAVDTTTFTASYVVTQADIDAGEFSNQAEVTATAPGGSEVTDLSDESSILEDDPTITVICPIINAEDDSAGPIAGVNVEVENILNVFDNDTYNGQAAGLSLVTLQEVIAEPNGYLTLNADGSVDLEANTPVGTYQLTYQICSIQYPTICDTAVVTITVEAPLITLSAVSECDNDTPYLSYTITLENFTIDPDIVTIEWKDNNDVVIQTDTDTPTSSIINGQEVLTGRILWAGAEVDADGNPTDWPGWYFENGQWIQGDDGYQDLRPTATVTISINPTETIVVDYPPSSPFCITSPPAIALIKEAVLLDTDSNGNCIVAVGDEIQYNFTVSNVGSSNLTNVMVTDDNATVVGGPITLVENETDTTSFTATHIITQADIDAGFVENQATAEGTPLIGPDVTDLSDFADNTQDRPTVTSICSGSSIALVKEADIQIDPSSGCYIVEVGGTIDYIFTVTNTGNTTLTNVVVIDNGVDMNGDPIASLAPGAVDTTTFTASYVVTQADIDAGEFSNQAEVTATAPGGSEVTDLSDESSILEDDPTITVICPIINAEDDSAGPIAGVNVEVENILNVFDNDTYNGQAAGLSLVTLQEVIAEPNGYLTLNADGSVDLEANTPVGTYQLTYQICSIQYPTICDTAVVTITVEAPLITLSAVSECDNDTPYLSYTITLENFTIDPDIVTIEWKDNNDVVIQTDTDTPTSSIINGQEVLTGRILWAGAEVDADGNPTDWPGWYFENGQWIQGDDGYQDLRPTATVTISINPTETIVVDYPPSSPFCITSPPAIALIKEAVLLDTDSNGNCIVAVGDEIQYNFTVSNVGSSNLTNVMVTDDNATVVGGPITLVENETDTTSFTATHIITQADIDAGFVENQATAEGTPLIGPDVTDLSDFADNTQDRPTVTSICQDPSIAIVKTAVLNDENNSGCSEAGVDTISYTFTVTNEGNVSLASVSVTDPLPGLGTISFDGGDADGDDELDVDETWTYSASYTLTQDDIDAGEVFNQATAEGTAPDQAIVEDLSGSTITTDDGTIIELCQSPAIAIVKEASYDDGGDCSQPGEDIFYTFTVTNQGNVTLSDIVVTDQLLGGVVPGPDSGDDNNDGLLQLDEVWVYTGIYIITQDDIDAGEVFNQATAEGTAPDQAIVEDLSGSTITTDDGTIIELCQSPAIAIVKEASYDDGGDCSQPGEEIFYTFTVTNQGNVTLSDIVVTDQLLGGVVPGPDSGDDNNDGLLQLDEVWVYTGIYIITQDDIDAGEVFNQATAEGTAPDQAIVEDLSGSTITTDDGTIIELCQSPAIAIVKEASYDDGGDCSQPGEDIFYTFTVTNQGNVTLSDIVVTDQLLGGVVPGPDSGDDNNDGLLQLDEVWVYTGIYIITQDDIDAGEVFNQATAEGTAPDQAIVEDLSGSTITTDDGTIIELCQSPAIAIVKEASYDDGGDCSQPGEEIFYTFTVTNQGNVTLSDIVVTDQLLGGVVPGPDSGDDNNDGLLQLDEVWVYTGIYIITQDDIDAGEVFNQATAEGTAPDQAIVEDLSGSTITTDDGTIIELCQSPAIAIVKEASYDDGGDCSQPGEEIFYTFTVTNQGNVTLSDIVVTDQLLGGVVPGPDSGDDNNDGLLQLDEVWVYTGIYIITQDDIDAGEVFNQATAEGTAPDQAIVEDLSGSTTTTDDPTIIELCQPESGIALIKVATLGDENGNNCPDLGETIVYTFEVKNVGDTLLNDVDVLDGVEVIGEPITSLAPGESDATNFQAIHTITQADIDAGFFENQATATGIAPDGSEVSDLSDDDSFFEDEPTIVTFCPIIITNITLTLEKSGVWIDEDQDGNADVGEQILYSFSVTNNHPTESVYNVTINDPLPGITIEGDPIPELGPLETDDTTFTGTYVITQEDIDNGKVINQAIVTATDITDAEIDDVSDDPTTEELNDPTVVTLPFVVGISFEIFNGVTPNDDGYNDFFFIKGIDNFPNNNVKIFNRWGVLIWETNGYDEDQNVFTGDADARMMIEGQKDAPTGTYFYVLTFFGNEQGVDYPDRKSYSGYLYLNR